MALNGSRLSVAPWASCNVFDGHVNGDVFEIFVMDRRLPGDDVTSWWRRSRELAIRRGAVVCIDSYALLVLLGDQLADSYDPSLAANVDAALTIRSKPRFEEYFANYYVASDVRRIMGSLSEAARVMADLMPSQVVRLARDGSVILSPTSMSTHALRAGDAIAATARLVPLVVRLLSDARDDDIVCFDGP